jgi:hypothetical protein
MSRGGFRSDYLLECWKYFIKLAVVIVMWKKGDSGQYSRTDNMTLCEFLYILLHCKWKYRNS